LALLLKRFSELEDDREAWRVVYAIGEVLLLVLRHDCVLDDLRTSSNGASIISIFCGSSPRSITAFRVRAARLGEPPLQSNVIFLGQTDGRSKESSVSLVMAAVPVGRCTSQFVGTPICYVNRGLHATDAAKFSP
jgi:hypothetical protein